MVQFRNWTDAVVGEGQLAGRAQRTRRGRGEGDAENTLGEVQAVDQVAGLSPQRPSAERLLETLRGEPGLRPRGAVDSAPSWDSSFPATVLALWTPSSGPGT